MNQDIPVLTEEDDIVVLRKSDDEDCSVDIIVRGSNGFMGSAYEPSPLKRKLDEPEVAVLPSIS
jgi:hypothetical protein